MASWYDKLVNCLDGQWMIGSSGSNGGDKVALRSLWVGSILILATIGLQAFFDPTLKGPLSWNGFCNQLNGLGPVVGGIYGGTYAAFYARFVSQWSYLANLYNQIKQAESAKDANEDVLAQWKAGYIEDAETLHLLCKRSVAPVVRAWSSDQGVIDAYVKDTPGGMNRLNRIRAEVDAACATLTLQELGRNK